MTTEEIQVAAIAENLKNPDGTEITTEEQLIAARELAANPPEEVVETPEEKAARELKEAEEAAANDPLLKVLMQNRKTEEQLEEPPAEEPVVPAPEPAADRVKNLATLTEWGVTMPTDATDEAIAAKVAEGKPAAAPPEPKKKGKKFSVVKKEHEAIIDPPPAVSTALPPPAPPAPDADAEYIKTLTAEQQDELYEAEVAELLEPVKFKGQKQKLIEFYKRFDREVGEITAKEPDAKLEDHDQFKALVRAKPSLDPVIVKRVNREIGSREGERRAETKLSPKIQEMEMTQRRIELKPVFEKFVTEEFKPGIALLIENDAQSPVAEAFKVIKEKGVKYAKDEGYALEAKIYTEETEAAARRAEKFLLFKNNAITYDPKAPDADIKWVMEFVESEGRIFADYESKHGRLMDKQRTFLPRRDFIQMLRTNAAEASTLDQRNWKTKSFCTFTDTGILDFLARAAKMTIEARVKQVQQNAEEVGFQRRPKAESKPPVNQPKRTPAELQPPRATPAPSAGAGRPPEPAKPNQTIDVLGINYPGMKRGR